MKTTTQNKPKSYADYNVPQLKAMLGMSYAELFWLRVDMICEFLQSIAIDEQEYLEWLNNTQIQKEAWYRIEQLIEPYLLDQTKQNASGDLSVVLPVSNRVVVATKPEYNITLYKLFVQEALKDLWT